MERPLESFRAEGARQAMTPELLANGVATQGHRQDISGRIVPGSMPGPMCCLGSLKAILERLQISLRLSSPVLFDDLRQGVFVIYKISGGISLTAIMTEFRSPRVISCANQPEITNNTISPQSTSPSAPYLTSLSRESNQLIYF